jgi:hypothetical protein
VDALDSLKSLVSSDDLSRFIAYGILFHIDKLLSGKILAREIMGCLSAKKYDRFLKIARLSGNKSISRKAALWMDKPESYRKRVLLVKRMKRPVHKIAMMINRLRSAV